MTITTPRQESAESDPTPAAPTSWVERLGPAGSRAWEEGWLDGVRGVAVLMVVLFHVWLSAGSPHPQVLGFDLYWFPLTLGTGVSLFFLLSGFLLARPWFVAEARGAEGPPVRRFYVRRVKRIVPAYYLSVALLLIVFVPLGAIEIRAVTGRLGLENLAGQLLFLQGYLPVSSGNLNGTNGVFWTLTVEMTLYLLLPLMAAAFLGRRWVLALPASLMLSLGWLWATRDGLDPLVSAMVESVKDDGGTVWVAATDWHMRDLLAVMFPAWVFTFALGVGIAKLVAVHAHRTASGLPALWWADRRRAGVAFLLGTAAVLVTFYLVGTGSSGPQPSWFWNEAMRPILPSLALAVVLFGVAFGPATLRRPLQWLPMRYLGWIGYGVYLTHVPVLHVLRTYTDLDEGGGTRALPLLLLVTLPIVTLLGTLSWLCVERPLLRRSDGRRPGRVVAAILVVAAVLAGGVVAWKHARANDPSAASNGLFARAVEGGRMDRTLSGAATVRVAQDKGLLYLHEAEALRRCGARTGSTSVIVTPQWSVSATAFACRSDQGADSAWEALTAKELELGFATTGQPDPGTSVFFRDTDPPTPTHPYQFHVRRVVADHVVGLAVQARTEEAGRAAVNELLIALDEQLQPSVED